MTYYKDMYKNSNYVKLQKLYAERKQLEIALGHNDDLICSGGGRARHTKKLNASYYGTTACPQDYMHEILSNVVDVNRDTDHNKIVNWKYIGEKR